jgi:hypothetical protein
MRDLTQKSNVFSDLFITYEGSIEDKNHQSINQKAADQPFIPATEAPPTSMGGIIHFIALIIGFETIGILSQLIYMRSHLFLISRRRTPGLVIVFYCSKTSPFQNY